MLHCELDEVFRALADPTRRAIVERLTEGAASVSQLRTPFAMSLTAIGQHVQLLEQSGLVTSKKQGRVRIVELNGAALASVEAWFENRRRTWEKRLDRLGELLADEDDSTK